MPADLDFKHAQMATGVFPFLRSTFYRWAQVSPEICLDPDVELRGEWVLRHLAPNCARVPLESLADEKDALRLLRAMIWKNVPLGSSKAVEDVQRHLAGLLKKWLPHTMDVMPQSRKQDYEAWGKEAGNEATSAKYS